MQNLYIETIFKNYSELDTKSIEKNAQEVLALRYFMDLPNGEKETQFSQLCRRVARIITSGEYKEHCSDSHILYMTKIEESIYNDMMSHRFLFNSPALFSAGSGISSDPNLSEYLYVLPLANYAESYREIYRIISSNYNKNQMMFACFTISVPDSIEGIFDSVKNASIISKYGGGVGASFTHLREKDSLIAGGCGGKASGPISFMETWNTMGSVVVQGGKRRAALMGMLRSDHPDIIDFIEAKHEDGKLSYFNISVAIDNKFMEAVKNDDEYDLISPASNQVVRTIKARDLWDKICNSAHKNGDPGIFFIDTCNDDNLLKKDPKYYIETTNPCGEQPLANEGSCNLGSINLSEFVDSAGNFKTQEFINQILRSMYYLDLVTDVTTFPLEEIKKNTLDTRPVGLGVMGLADMCIKMNIVYGSEEFKEISKKIAKLLSKYSLIGSIEMAAIKGSYPHYDNEKYGLASEIKYILKDMYEIRYTGPDTISERSFKIIKNISNSDLPISFKNALYEIIDDMSDLNFDEKEPKDEFIVLKSFINDILDILYKSGLRNSRRLSIAPTGTISLLLNTSASIEPNFAYSWERYVMINEKEKQKFNYYHSLYNEKNKKAGLLVTAHDLSIVQHVEVVKIFAEYIDSAISKTINMSYESTVADVKKIYEYCFNNKIKGITIYRDGSRNNQPIVKTEKIIENDNDYESNIKKRPQFIPGITRKSDSPFGSIYITANFDKNNKMFETFISAGKSGSVSKSITEALSRVISLALRGGINIEDIIKTLNNISGSEAWVYDSYNNGEIIVKSIPDVTSKMLKDIIEYYKDICINFNFPDIQEEEEKHVLNKTEVNEDACPECGASMVMVSGCKICYQCGFSPCK